MSQLHRLMSSGMRPPLPMGAISEDGASIDDATLGGGPGSADADNDALAPLPWSEFFDATHDVATGSGVFRAYTAGPLNQCTFVLIHGGGLAALSWATTAEHLKGSNGVFTFDMRQHGDTQTDNEEDLSIDTLVSDVGEVVNAFFAEGAPPIVLVGHSLGGAIAARVAEAGLIDSLVGFVLVDVVEGTAISALAHMPTFLAGRPQEFDSLNAAVGWVIKSKTVRSERSARASTAPQFKLNDEGKYVWRTDLMSSKDYWQGWFEGLSDSFLAVRLPKILMLASTNRLDTPLTIAQMQGKFQMTILGGCGHSVHEDAPEEAAAALLAFTTRNGW